MQKPLLLFVSFLFFACKENSTFSKPIQQTFALSFQQKELTDKNSWSWFLQHLPEKKGPVVDYRGNVITDQHKAYTLINYDVGTRDLQQCADALMRLRAEYLFGQKRLDEIRFHFTSGHLYSFLDYCSGKRPAPDGNGIRYTTTSPVAATHQSLRRYLDIVYTYAGTISLAKELRATNQFTIGTIVITPGSPGHCFIITDEATTANGDKVYKLVEGYTPAQSIYVLQNVAEPKLTYWHRLSGGPIQTASYTFRAYQLKAFE